MIDPRKRTPSERLSGISDEERVRLRELESMRMGDFFGRERAVEDHLSARSNQIRVRGL